MVNITLTYMEHVYKNKHIHAVVIIYSLLPIATVGRTLLGFSHSKRLQVSQECLNFSFVIPLSPTLFPSSLGLHIPLLPNDFLVLFPCPHCKICPVPL